MASQQSETFAMVMSEKIEIPNKQKTGVNSNPGKFEYLECVGIKELANFEMTNSKLKDLKKDLIVKLFIKLQTYIRSRYVDDEEDSGIPSRDSSNDTIQCSSTQDIHSANDFCRIIGESLSQIRRQADYINELHTKLYKASEDKEKISTERAILETRVSELDKRVQEFSIDSHAKSMEIDKLLNDKTQPDPALDVNFTGGDVNALILEVVDELAARKEKESNLVIYGISEDADVDDEDNPLKTQVQGIFDMMNCTCQIEKCFRLGRPRELQAKPRPVKVFLTNAQDKMNILAKSKTYFKGLRNGHELKRIYIRSDLTKSQRDANQLNHRGPRSVQREDINPENFEDDFPRLHPGRMGPPDHLFGFGNYRGRYQAGRRRRARGRGHPREPFRGAPRGGRMQHYWHPQHATLQQQPQQQLHINTPTAAPDIGPERNEQPPPPPEEITDSQTPLLDESIGSESEEAIHQDEW